MSHNGATSPSPIEQSGCCVSFHTQTQVISGMVSGCFWLLFLALLTFQFQCLHMLQLHKKQQPPGASDGFQDILSHLCMTFTTHNHLFSAFHKRRHSTQSLPFHLPRRLINDWASLLPILADSETNIIALSGFCLIPRPSAQHSASIRTDSASWLSTKSSRNDIPCSFLLSSSTISFLSCLLFATVEHGDEAQGRLMHIVCF